MSVRTRVTALRVQHFRTMALFAVALGAPHSALAGSFSLFGVESDYKLTLGYTAAIRTEKQDQNLVNGPIDPLVSDPKYGTPAGFGHTGLPTTINFDDANNNFNRYSLINNRVTGFGQIEFRYANFGAAFSGSAFYDQVYHERNDNRSPPADGSSRSTVNKLGAPNEFTDDTRYFSGRRARMLDAFAFADFGITDEIFLNIRAGRHVVAYGESLFLSGISSTQGPFDATKAFIAGAEIKDIILPESQISMQMSLTSKLNLMAHYQLDFHPTEIFPNGDFFSPADVVGPGATFVYGSINPAGGNGCVGLFPPPFDAACNTGNLGDLIISAGPYILVDRLADINPSRYGHYGVGLKYQITPETNLGLFRTRYADHNPSVQLNPGFAPIGTLPNGTVVTTELLQQYVPITYNIKYFDAITLTGFTFTTVALGVNFAGEFNYREDVPMAVKADISGVVAPVTTRGKLGQFLLSALYTTNPGFFFDDLVFVGEAGIVHVHSNDGIKPSLGVIPDGDGRTLFYNRDSWGFQMLITATKRNLVSGLDFTPIISYGEISKGNPSLSGAFGALYGQGDRRLTVGFKGQYLQNLEVGLAYNMIFGDANKKIGNSNLFQNPYTDKDYASINLKYNF